MDLGSFDPQHLTIVQVVGLTIIVTVIDVLAAMILAITQSKFSLAFVAGWIQSHTIKRIFPIFAMAWLGTGVPQIDIPAIPPLFLAAVAGLVAYVAETVKSVQTNFADATAVKDESPIPPSPPPIV